MITIDLGIGLSVGAIIGFIARSISNHCLAQSRNKENIRLIAIEKNTAIFRAVFDSVIAQIEILRPPKSQFKIITAEESPFDIIAFLRSSLKAQTEAIKAYSYFIPENEKEEYQKAWENYKESVLSGSVFFVNLFGLEDPFDYIENKIHAILHFAKEK